MANVRLPLLVIVVAAIILHTHPSVEAHRGQKHFVLVHGLGAGAWCWFKTTTLLQQAGHQVTTIDLTSNGNSKVIADTVTSVAYYVQPLIQFLANDIHSPNKVILVAHSLGGSGITYAMELFPEKISKAIFVAAIMPSNNQSFLPTAVFQGVQTLFQKGVATLNFANGASNPATSIVINPALVKDYLLNESPLEDVNLAKVSINPTPAIPLGEVLNLTPSKYGSIKRFYIKTSLGDRVIVPSLQASMIEQNPPYKEFLIEGSDHCPFISKHVVLNKLLLTIAAS